MRDEFSKPVINKARLSAAFICSNPSCRRLTIRPSPDSESGAMVLGKVSHITAAAPGGPRFRASLSAGKRSALDNAIYLCATCAELIDKNGGIDFPEALLRQWKKDHEAWVARNVNKSMDHEERPRLEPEFMLYGSQQGMASLGVLLHVVGDVAAVDVTIEARIEPQLPGHPSAGRARWERIGPTMLGDCERVIPEIDMIKLPLESRIVAAMGFKNADGHQWTETFHEDLKATIDRSKTVDLLS